MVPAHTTLALTCRRGSPVRADEPARTLRDVIEVLRTMVGIAATVEAMVSACEELKEYVPLIGKIPNVKERVLRTLEIMGLVAAEDDDSEDEAG